MTVTAETFFRVPAEPVEASRIAKIGSALGKRWDEFQKQHPDRHCVRVRSMNMVVVCSTPEAAAGLAELVEEVADRHPGRIVCVVLDPDYTGPLQAWYAVKCSPWRPSSTRWKPTWASRRGGRLFAASGLRKRLTECRKKLKNLLSALEQGILFDDMQVRIRDLKAQEGELADEIGRCQAEASRSVGLDVAVTREYLEGLRRDIESADLARLAVLIPHALKLELDLVEKRGLYYVGIPTEKARPAELALPRAAGGKTPVRMVVGVPGRAYGRGSAFIPLGPFAWKS